MLARNWKKICIFILIVACLFNVVIKLVRRVSFNKEILSSARYTAIQHQYVIILDSSFWGGQKSPKL